MELKSSSGTVPLSLLSIALSPSVLKGPLRQIWEYLDDNSMLQWVTTCSVLYAKESPTLPLHESIRVFSLFSRLPHSALRVQKFHVFSNKTDEEEDKEKIRKIQWIFKGLTLIETEEFLKQTENFSADLMNSPLNEIIKMSDLNDQKEYLEFQEISKQIQGYLPTYSQMNSLTSISFDLTSDSFPLIFSDFSSLLKSSECPINSVDFFEKIQWKNLRKTKKTPDIKLWKILKDSHSLTHIGFEMIELDTQAMEKFTEIIEQNKSLKSIDFKGGRLKSFPKLWEIIGKNQNIKKIQMNYTIVEDLEKLLSALIENKSIEWISLPDPMDIDDVPPTLWNTLLTNNSNIKTLHLPHRHFLPETHLDIILNCLSLSSPYCFIEKIHFSQETFEEFFEKFTNWITEENQKTREKSLNLMMKIHHLDEQKGDLIMKSMKRGKGVDGEKLLNVGIHVENSSNQQYLNEIRLREPRIWITQTWGK